MINSSEIDKKRLFFVQEDDYNYLALNVLLILFLFERKSEEKVFTDHRKLSYIIDFCSDERLLNILDRTKEREGVVEDIELLSRAYSNSIYRIKTINQLIHFLIQSDIIGVKSRKNEELNIWLKTDNLPEGFLDKGNFIEERKNIKELKSLIKQLTKIKLETLLKTVYYNRGVKDVNH